MEERDTHTRAVTAFGVTLPPPLLATSAKHLTKQKIDFLLTQPQLARSMAPVAFPTANTQLQPGKVQSTSRVTGRLVQLRELARDIVEATVAHDEPMRVLPGQYCHFSFAGFPHRKFSPTANLAAIRDDGYIRLHIKRVRGGQVTSQLGRAIKTGHRVEIEGPFGRGFKRPAPFVRLILIGSGTGFAPIWSIATATLREAPTTAIVLAGAAPTLDSFYMAPALELARCYPKVSIVATVDEIADNWHGFLPGPPVAHLPSLSSNDIVYAAGSHALVGAAGKAAAAAGASFCADPLEPASPATGNWLRCARQWLTAG